jgi:YfiH family protein
LRQPEPGDGAWREIAESLGSTEADLVRVRQVHGAEVVAGRGPGHDLRLADAIVADEPGLALAVQSADCVPLLLADRRGRAVAAVHAGWRGLAVGAPQAAVDELSRRYDVDSGDLLVAIGPCIGACCYQVDDLVRARFDSRIAGCFLERATPTLRNPSMAGVEPGPESGRYYLDMAAAARLQVAAAGVPDRQIFTADLCTASHPDVLCSFRRDGVSAGRMVGAIRRRI